MPSYRAESFLTLRFGAEDDVYGVGRWMQENDSQGCLFHDAVLSHPGSERIKAMYVWHKQEVAQAMEKVTGLDGKSGQLLLIHEGIVQSWPLLGVDAVVNAQSLLSGV